MLPGGRRRAERAGWTGRHNRTSFRELPKFACPEAGRASLMDDMTSRRRRMTAEHSTLIELLVVIAIIAVLIGPAAAGRAKGPRGRRPRRPAQNNLKQIGLALHNYHNLNGRFPAAKIHSGVATAFQANYSRPGGQLRRRAVQGLQPHRLGRPAAVHRAGRPVSQVRLPRPVVESVASAGINGPQYLGGTREHERGRGRHVSCGSTPARATKTRRRSSTDNGHPADPLAIPPVELLVEWHAYSRQNARRSNYLFASYLDTDADAAISRRARSSARSAPTGRRALAAIYGRD